MNQDVPKPDAEDYSASPLFKAPEFLPEDPELWLAQLECQFLNLNIAGEPKRFRQLAAALPRSLASDVRDVILHPPEHAPYTALKEALLKRTALSEERRIRNLLDGIHLDDRSPSQLLRHMRQLAGDVISEAVLRQLWLKRLPQRVQSVISIFSLHCPLDELAEGADRAMESPATIASASTSGDDHASMRAELNEIRETLKSLRLRSRSRSHRRFPRSRHSSRSSARKGQPDTCWYHEHYGDKARNCRPPCKHHEAWASKNL